jgi:hypothetical protein
LSSSQLAKKLELGHTLQQTAAGRTHTYVLVNTFKHRNRHGYVVDVPVWTGTCATCGCPFEATGSRNIRRYLIRNCPTHRRKRRSMTNKQEPRAAFLCSRNSEV